MIPLSRPVLGNEEKKAVSEVLESGILVQGPKVREFEKQFAAYVGRKHAIATSSGTAALHTALLALGVGRGEEAILPPLTFVSCASMTIAVGAKPVFADVERDTYNIDPARVKESVTKRTKVIMPVHLFGQPADMDPIMDLAKEREIAVIEDACQAHGALYKGKKAGSMGHLSCFSFYPSKNMTTGEGGMILTDDDEMARRCQMIRNHGGLGRYEHQMVGYNYRMTEMAAAIGLEQIKKLDTLVKRRRRNAAFLTQGLDGIPGLALPKEKTDRVHAFYQYIVRVESGFSKERDSLVEMLNDKGIPSRPSYPMPLYRQKALVDLGIKAHCPVAEEVLPRMLELPVHPLLTQDDLQRVVSAVKEAV